MQVFERILYIIDFFRLSKTEFSKMIGLAQTTFLGYLSEEGQSKIRVTMLEDILSAYPNVNRNWLFFGEGEMLKANTPESKPACEPVASPATDVQAELEKLRAELDEERRLCRKLTLRLLMEGDPHKDCASGETDTAADGQK